MSVRVAQDAHRLLRLRTPRPRHRPRRRAPQPTPGRPPRCRGGPASAARPAPRARPAGRGRTRAGTTGPRRPVPAGPPSPGPPTPSRNRAGGGRTAPAPAGRGVEDGRGSAGASSPPAWAVSARPAPCARRRATPTAGRRRSTGIAATRPRSAPHQHGRTDEQQQHGHHHRPTGRRELTLLPAHRDVRCCTRSTGTGSSERCVARGPLNILDGAGAKQREHQASSGRNPRPHCGQSGADATGSTPSHRSSAAALSGCRPGQDAPRGPDLGSGAQEGGRHRDATTARRRPVRRSPPPARSRTSQHPGARPRPRHRRSGRGAGPGSTSCAGPRRAPPPARGRRLMVHHRPVDRRSVPPSVSSSVDLERDRRAPWPGPCVRAGTTALSSRSRRPSATRRSCWSANS